MIRLGGFFYFFVFASLIFCFLCYLNIDPIKSCLFLVLSLLRVSPFISFGGQTWFCYFICMIFLSGIFVILVYFTRLSKYNFFGFSLSILIFFGCFFVPLYFFLSDLKLYRVYFVDFSFIILWVIFSLFFFINFSRYFLNFSGALRKA